MPRGERRASPQSASAPPAITDTTRSVSPTFTVRMARPSPGRERRSIRSNVPAQVEPVLLRKERRPEVAPPRDPRRHVVDAEVLDANGPLHLAPRDGSGDAGPRVWPHRVHRRKRAPPRVLVVVDVHAVRGPAGLGVDRRHEAGMMGRELAG